ncbi:adenylyl-sulfate kinase [Legionella septentrionalis]|uniref:Adenylyl-sulfate kinase n=1 Tax=Legionella septentrionalis TaxID=2498109 RepID=A0A3S0XST6_9GAMM|nr:adenylyl-sulfate kinase [Legionella septentrionalis]RUQ94330.1 adenylyl-sulfate kinase [Legionella septentrionalis]
MLIVFGGLPGTGKTTISKEIAKILKAVYLRVDTIEQTIKNSKKGLIGPEGYLISYAVAKENLQLGLSVVADSVNPIEITRNDWREIANSIGIKSLEVEIICSDLVEHQKRIETRVSDIQGHKLPTWDEVKMRDYEKWDSATLCIDTTQCSPEEAIRVIIAHIEQLS